MLHLLENQLSHSFVNQALSAIKFYLFTVCGRNDLPFNLPRPKKESKLPDILSQEEVIQLIQTIQNVKHRAIRPAGNDPDRGTEDDSDPDVSRIRNVKGSSGCKAS